MCDECPICQDINCVHEEQDNPELVASMLDDQIEAYEDYMDRDCDF